MKHKKEVTIYDIAKVLNLSASTVSRGLNDHPSINKETKKRILAQAKKMNFQMNTFAISLRRKQSNTIGVIVPRLDSYFMSSAISGIETILNSKGYNLIISQSQESIAKEKLNIGTMYNSRVEGLLISLSNETDNIEHLKIFLDKKIPVVFFDRVYKHPDFTCVIIDNFKAGYEATMHLIEQGCKNIIHFTGNLLVNVYRDRHEGYRRALSDSGIPYNIDYVFANKIDKKSINDLLNKIQKKELTPDGIFAANDISAATIMSQLKDMGYNIPKDIAIVGFNNNPISQLVDPNLSTVQYPGEQAGEIAATTLIEQINNERNSSINTVVLNHELLIRASSQKKKN